MVCQRVIRDIGQNAENDDLGFYKWIFIETFNLS
jgi:hypothetical protein